MGLYVHVFFKRKVCFERKNLYFDLPLLERYEFIKDILRRFPASLRQSTSFQEKDLFVRRER